MKSIDNKKAHQILADRGFGVDNKGILTMPNIHHITDDKQVQISEHHLVCLISFINSAQEAFYQIGGLSALTAEKAEKYSIAHTLAVSTAEKSNTWADNCLDELEALKEQSSVVANWVSKMQSSLL